MAAGIEDLHDGIGQHRQPHAHGDGEEGRDAHGVLGDLRGVAPRALRDGPGDGRDDGDGQRRDERGGQVEQGLRLAVYAVEDLRLTVGEMRGTLKPVHAELGVDTVEKRHDAGPGRDGDADGEDVFDDLHGGVGRVVVLRDVVRIMDARSVRGGEA